MYILHPLVHITFMLSLTQHRLVRSALQYTISTTRASTNSKSNILPTTSTHSNANTITNSNINPTISSILHTTTSRAFSLQMKRRGDSTNTTTKAQLNDAVPAHLLPRNSITTIKSGGIIFVKDLNARIGSLINISTAEAGIVQAIVLRSTAKGVLAGLTGPEHLVHRGDVAFIPTSYYDSSSILDSDFEDFKPSDTIDMEDINDDTLVADDAQILWPRFPTGIHTLGSIYTPMGENLDYFFSGVLPSRNTQKNNNNPHTSTSIPTSTSTSYTSTHIPNSTQSLSSTSPSLTSNSCLLPSFVNIRRDNITQRLPITAYAQPTDGAAIFTGIKIFDSLHPLRRGSRTALISSEKNSLFTLTQEMLGSIALQNNTLKSIKQLPTGYTDSQIHTISKPSSPIAFIYVIIGQPQAYARRVIEHLKKSGALPYTTIIFADVKLSVAQQYFALQSAQAAANAWRDAGMHSICIIDDIAAHSKAVDMIIRTSVDGGKDAEASAQPLSVGAEQASVIDGFSHLSTSFGGGSSTAICLFIDENADKHLQPFEMRRSKASRASLQSACDTTINLTEVNNTLQGTRSNSSNNNVSSNNNNNNNNNNAVIPSSFPPIKIIPSIINSRYAFPIFRELLHEFHTLLIRAKDAEQRKTTGSELGIEPEEDDIIFMDWKKKVDIIMSQDLNTFTPLPVQYLLLFVITHNSLLSGFPVERSMILEQFLVDLMSEEGELMKKIDHEIMMSALTNAIITNDGKTYYGLSVDVGMQLEQFIEEALFEFSMQFGDDVDVDMSQYQ